MILSVKTIGKCGAACLLELKSCVVLMRKLALFFGNSCMICMLQKFLIFNLPVNFLYFLSNWINLLDISSICNMLRAIWKKSKPLKQLSIILNTSTFLRVVNNLVLITSVVIHRWNGFLCGNKNSRLFFAKKFPWFNKHTLWSVRKKKHYVSVAWPFENM